MYTRWMKGAAAGLALLWAAPGELVAQTGQCAGIAAWQASTIYQPGDRLVYENRLYRAAIPIWNAPPTHCPSCGWYVDLGPCGAVGNQPPTVQLTAPAHGTNVAVGSAVTVSANAGDADGQVVSVEFFRGAASLGVDTSVPYSVVWSNATAGSHTFTAVATDNGGARTTSTPVTIAVSQGPGPDTTPPSVPSGLSSSSQTATSITLSWSASTDNPGGSGIAGYDVYRNGGLVGSPSGTGYSDTGLTPDTAYSYRVRARDQAGNASAQSAALSVRTRPQGTGGNRRVTAYFVQWGIYARNYLVRNIVSSGTASRITHINYAFGNVRNNRCEVGINQPADPNTGAGGDAWADYGRSFNAAESVDGIADTWDQPLRGNWNQLRKLKQLRPNTKVLISLGGWTWSQGFSEAARPENRVAFVRSCIDAYIRGHLPVTDGAGGTGAAAGVFDGIDIDWEYPVACGQACGRPEDRQNFTALLAEFRRQLDAVRPGLELTVAVGAGADKIRVTDPNLYHPYLDAILVMTYDFNGTWDPRTNHHSPLFHSPANPGAGDLRYYNTHDALDQFIQRGVPASKLHIGIGFYGRGWTGVPNVNNGLFQSGHAAPGTYEAGNEDYKVLRTLGWPSFRDPVAGAHWIYNGNTFWSFDDPQMVRDKMLYARQMGLGGAFFWELSGDDAQGSLARAVHEGLNP